MLDWLFGKYNVYYRLGDGGAIWHRRFREIDHARAFCALTTGAVIVETGEKYVYRDRIAT